MGLVVPLSEKPMPQAGFRFLRSYGTLIKLTHSLHLSSLVEPGSSQLEKVESAARVRQGCVTGSAAVSKDRVDCRVE